MDILPEQPKKLTAYELLGSEPRPYPFLSQHFNPFFFGFLGVSSGFLYNFLGKRPLISGMQRQIGLGAVGFIIGKVLDDRRSKGLARRDAVLRHYIELHPEDFPEPERKKFKDILLRWVPVR
ncbi:NADH dehydrogenase [ubiquinone] 1 subunit C2 [Hetaerina americana]|uniref:NADH dehydrogenase [ubiquinone] 1 subunit C2 n=1 Tax=Hetaerina americana TaxID=62018 RepID=UPI003A7F5385